MSDPKTLLQIHAVIYSQRRVTMYTKRYGYPRESPMVVLDRDYAS